MATSTYSRVTNLLLSGVCNLLTAANHHSTVLGAILARRQRWEQAAPIGVQALAVASGLVNSRQFDLVGVHLPAINYLVFLPLVQTLHVSVVLQIGAWRLRPTRPATVVIHGAPLATRVVARSVGILSLVTI